MKRVTIISVLADLFLCFWYLASIVGIDIHVDHHDGETYVASLLGRTDCENLHPEDECHCVDHHHGCCDGQDEDCENVISVLSLTGDGFDFVCDLAPVTSPLMTIGTVPVMETGSEEIYSYHSFGGPPRERLRSLCVLRV
ncbi:MAG: hypothetical protein MJY89_02205 [Bacteroidales bacterium]|nr:hypothetical protein [Bacteroidales bacterium]